MPRTARENALRPLVPWALAALAACALVAYLGLESFAWNDYELEAQPAVTALVHGHLAGFLRLAPAYGGSLIERAPFALLPGLWGGGALAVYRLLAVPGLLASAALAIWLLARMRAQRRPRAACALALILCTANPITLQALEVGHVEELLGACMCVAAVLLAAADRPWWAGLVLGLAIANKEWALLAVGPTLLALPPRRRLACGACALAVAVAVLAPLALIHSGGFVSSTRAMATSSSSIFQPWQLWWFLGRHGPLVHGLLGPKPGYRTGPGWASAIAHPLILLSGVTISLALWRRERRTGPTGERDALLALALVLLLRCLLDTWDTPYYLLPFALALLAWDTTGARARLPALAAAATALATIGFQWLPEHVSPDAVAGFFLAWSLPLALALGWRLLRPPRREAVMQMTVARVAPPHEIAVSALSRPLRIS